ncbi:MAG: ATP-binding cassette domain-containing protein [Oscillospiraceae bacterium]|nr:ATP-binding cassette domain-containing protein [Oscillospiraceae bacterium]
MQEKKTEEKKIKGLAKLRYALFLLGPYWRHGRTYLIVITLVSVFLQPASTFLITLLPQLAIDSVMREDSRNQTLTIVAVLSVVIVFITVVRRMVELYYERPTQWKLQRRVQNEVNTKALYTDFKYYDNPEFYAKFNFAQEEFPWQARMAAWYFPYALKDIATVLAMGAIISQAGPVLFAITAAFVVMGTLVVLPTIKPEADINMKIDDVWRPVGYIDRLLRQKENAAELRSSGAGRKFLKTFEAAQKRMVDTYAPFRKKVTPFYVTQSALPHVQAACILLYIVFFIIEGDVTQIGLFASLSVASTQFATHLGHVLTNVKGLMELSVNGERIAAFFEAESVIEPERDNVLPPPTGKFELEFRNVSFGYENAKFCIEGLNLRIKPGQRVAIVGENGAGKSTITKLLLRLYDVSGGELLINGVNIKDFDVHALRLRVGIAFQDVRVLAMSLRDNLTVYNDVDDEQLMEVIAKLGLEGVLEKAGGDMNKMVSREFTEDGVVLSGGEAQRITLARLFTGTFGVMILDEPSSALDPLAEHKLMQTILDASNTSTTIMIAHRLSTVRDFDVIYHMENGAIIESGTHAELMALQGGYYDMFTKQAENYQAQELQG